MRLRPGLRLRLAACQMDATAGDAGGSDETTGLGDLLGALRPSHLHLEGSSDGKLLASLLQEHTQLEALSIAMDQPRWLNNELLWLLLRNKPRLRRLELEGCGIETRCNSIDASYLTVQCLRTLHDRGHLDALRHLSLGVSAAWAEYAAPQLTFLTQLASIKLGQEGSTSPAAAAVQRLRRALPLCMAAGDDLLAEWRLSDACYYD